MVHAEKDKGTVLILELVEAKLQLSQTLRPSKVHFQWCPHFAWKRWLLVAASECPRPDCVHFLILGTT